MSDIQLKIDELDVIIREMVTYVEFTRYGRTVGAWRDESTGQFVSGP
jgi:hypothetical protein